MDSDIVLDVIKQDISAALKALDEGDFRFITIMGNRLASNLLIGERNDLMVLGYLLREVGREFDGIKRIDEKRLDRCREHGKKFIKSLQNIIGKGKINPKEMWGLYYEYESGIRKYIPTDIEISVYKDIPEFTAQTTSMLVKHFETHKELLLKENNELINGILNELSRVINVHGLKHRDLVFYMLLQALKGYYEYLLYTETRDGIIKNEEEFKNKIYPYVDRIVKLVSDFDTEKDKTYKESNEILGELCSAWRKYFINYMDIIRAYPERKVEIIPEEAKKKIGETVAKALEEEAKKK